MTYLVICNDHAHALSTFERYHKAYPTARVDRAALTINNGGDLFYVMRRNIENPWNLGSMEFDGVIIPPGYIHPLTFELVAISRARY